MAEQEQAWQKYATSNFKDIMKNIGTGAEYQIGSDVTKGAIGGIKDFINNVVHKKHDQPAPQQTAPQQTPQYAGGYNPGGYYGGGAQITPFNFQAQITAAIPQLMQQIQAGKTAFQQLQQIMQVLTPEQQQAIMTQLMS